jgi:glycine hydroxymethyltransferase
MTTRGFKETDMKEVARLIGRVLKQHEDEAVIAEALQDVRSLTAKFPLYPERG